MLSINSTWAAHRKEHAAFHDRFPQLPVTSGFEATVRAQISLSSPTLCLQDVDRALELANEMSARNIERNVHTYTVCLTQPSLILKCQQAEVSGIPHHHHFCKHLCAKHWTAAGHQGSQS